MELKMKCLGFTENF